MKGKTKSGFKFDIDERVLTDWRFTIAVAKTQGEDTLQKLAGANEMVELLLGAEGHQALIAHVAAANDGYVPSDVFMEEVTEIMQSSAKTKN